MNLEYLANRIDPDNWISHHFDEKARQKRLPREQEYLQSLDWTPEQQAVYQLRIFGVEERLKAVMERKKK